MAESRTGSPERIGGQWEGGGRERSEMPPIEVVILLASMMAGEAQVVGVEGMMAVCSVAENRVADPRFGGDLREVIMEGFVARGQVDPLHLWLARACLNTSDTTGGMLYAISQQDRVRLGCPRGQIVIGEWPMQIHMSREWCQ